MKSSFFIPRWPEACTIGVPDTYRGETVKAWIVVKQGETVTKEELSTYCKNNLAAYKVPKSFRFVDELPKSAIGKLMRREVRQMELDKEENAGYNNKRGNRQGHPFVPMRLSEKELSLPLFQVVVQGLDVPAVVHAPELHDDQPCLFQGGIPLGLVDEGKFLGKLLHFDLLRFQAFRPG